MNKPAHFSLLVLFAVCITSVAPVFAYTGSKEGASPYGREMRNTEIILVNWHDDGDGLFEYNERSENYGVIYINEHGVYIYRANTRKPTKFTIYNDQDKIVETLLSETNSVLLGKGNAPAGEFRIVAETDGLGQAVKQVKIVGEKATVWPVIKRLKAEAKAEKIPDVPQTKSAHWFKGEFSEKTSYRGQTLVGSPYGKGTMTFSSGDVYVGEFVGGIMHGKGTMTYSSGDVYVGDFFDGTMHGKGTLTYANGFIFTGDFLNNKPSGKGTMTSSNGAVYVGDFFEGAIHGQGTMTTVDRDVLRGTFENSSFSEGTVEYSDGKIYTGQYDGRLPHGYGELKLSDGSTYNGLWEHGGYIKAN